MTRGSGSFSALLGAFAVVSATAAFTGCGGGGGASADKPIVLGATLSVTGPLGGIGTVQKAGYEQAEKDINAAGGLKVGDTQRKVRIIVRDNRSDPTTATAQARDLILKDGAVGLLGACTPPITVPVGLVAEKERVPYVTSCTPVGAFRTGNDSGWKYSWDFFFSEEDQAKQVFAAAHRAPTNRKVALFVDTEPDGVVERVIYKRVAKAAGFEVVGDYTFPVGTTDYSSFVRNAKARGAEVVVGQMIPPDGVALWKQIKSLGYAPKVAFVSKAANQAGWQKALGEVGAGTLAEQFWSPTAGRPQTKELMGSLGKRFTSLPDLNGAVITYTVAQVMADAITRAGDTDPERINSAIAKTDREFPLAHIRFGSDHTATTPYLLFQWQGGRLEQVLPAVKNVKLQVPNPGLQ